MTSFISRFANVLICCLLLSACNSQSDNSANESVVDSVYERVDNATFKAKMAMADAVILDIRTPAETNRGIIEGAQIIDYRSSGFQQQLEALDRDKLYLIYCQSGGRSARAAKLMQSLGFKEIYELKHGYGGWN